MPWEKRPGVEQGTEMGLLAERTGLFPKRQVALLAPRGPSPLCPCSLQTVRCQGSYSPAPLSGRPWGCLLHRRTVSHESWAVEQTGDETAFGEGQLLLLKCINRKEPGKASPMLSAHSVDSSGFSRENPVNSMCVYMFT